MTKLAAFAPDVIVVQDGLNELLDRKLAQWPTYMHPGQPQFDSWLLNEYSSAVKTLEATGNGGKAKILFLNAVCVDWETVGGSFADYADNGDGDARVASLDHTSSAVAVDNATVVDYQSHLCPNGKFSSTVDGVANARPDGYHLSPAAGDAVAQRWLGPLIRQGNKPSTGL
jgi:hypothetical protein